MVFPRQSLQREHGFLSPCLLPHNCLPCFTSCLIVIRFVTESVTREDPGLTRSAQVEAGEPKRVSIQWGPGKVCAWADWLHEAASGRRRACPWGRPVMKMNCDVGPCTY